MLPELTVHRPQGVLPRVAVRKRTVVEYQPSWLLLALPAVALVRARAKKARAASPTEPSPAAAGDTSADTRRRRPAKAVLVRVTRLRRRGAADGSSPAEDVIVVSPVTPGA